MMTATPDVGEAAWSDFIGRLQRYVGGRLPPAVRDDVVGDILVRLVLNQAKLAAARDPMAWVGRVAANAVIDNARRRGAERRAVDAFAADPTANDDDAITEESVTTEIAACVKPLIARLPARYRDALTLVEIDGVAASDAAQRLGLSPSGLKSRLQRGRRQLKQAVLQCCTLELDRRGGVIDYRLRQASADDGCCPNAACS